LTYVDPELAESERYVEGEFVEPALNPGDLAHIRPGRELIWTEVAAKPEELPVITAVRVIPTDVYMKAYGFRCERVARNSKASEAIREEYRPAIDGIQEREKAEIRRIQDAARDEIQVYKGMTNQRIDKLPKIPELTDLIKELMGE